MYPQRAKSQTMKNCKTFLITSGVSNISVVQPHDTCNGPWRHAAYTNSLLEVDVRQYSRDLCRSVLSKLCLARFWLIWDV